MRRTLAARILSISRLRRCSTLRVAMGKWKRGGARIAAVVCAGSGSHVESIQQMAGKNKKYAHRDPTRSPSSDAAAFCFEGRCVHQYRPVLSTVLSTCSTASNCPNWLFECERGYEPRHTFSSHNVTVVCVLIYEMKNIAAPPPLLHVRHRNNSEGHAARPPTADHHRPLQTKLPLASGGVCCGRASATRKPPCICLKASATRSRAASV